MRQGCAVARSRARGRAAARAWPGFGTKLTPAGRLSLPAARASPFHEPMIGDVAFLEPFPTGRACVSRCRARMLDRRSGMRVMDRGANLGARSRSGRAIGDRGIRGRCERGHVRVRCARRRAASGEAREKETGARARGSVGRDTVVSGALHTISYGYGIMLVTPPPPSPPPKCPRMAPPNRQDMLCPPPIVTWRVGRGLGCCWSCV